MTSYAKGLSYLALFLFVTVAVHEVGHLVVVRRLISPEATVHFFPKFPFGRALGYVDIPASVTYPVWKDFVTALAGPFLAAVLMVVIWLNTENELMGVIASFFAVNQIVYSFVEPLNFIYALPKWSFMLPFLVASVWVISYAFYTR